VTGTLRQQLTQTAQSDGTTGTTGNTGFSVLTTGSGNTIIHANAAKMGATAGIRLTQGGANQNLAYLDDSAAQTIFTGRFPINIPTPSASCPVLRFYADTTHVTNLGTIQWLTSNRVQFIEGGAGSPLNLTSSSGTPLSGATNYYGEYLINCTTNAFTLNVYPLGSTTPAFTSLTGTLGADMAAASGIQSVRWSIGAASAVATVDTNSWFAIGDGTGGMLARADISTAPTVTISAGATDLEPGTTRTLTMTATPAGAATISSRAIVQTTGSPSVTISNPSTNTYTYTVPATSAGTTLAFKATATDSLGVPGESSPVSDVILPHDNWSWNASGTLVPVFMSQPW
jgi:hypothetical protein